MVKDCPIETEEQKTTFKRAFALFIQKSFLLPTSSAYISPIHLPVIRDIDNTRDRNWAHHVNSFLINGIKEFHDQGSQAVKGCHFVLMIIYFKEWYDGKSLNDPNTPAPWIERWTGERMKEKIKAEDEDITGLIQRAKMRAQKQKTNKKRTEGEDENPEDDADSMEFDTEEEEYHTTDSETDATNPAHDATIPETGPEHEPVRPLGPEPEPKPEPEPVMQPEPEPEPIILVGPEPQEVIDEFVAACEQVEETEDARELQERQEETAPVLHKLDQPAPTLMMVASVATQGQNYDPSKSFDLGIRTPRQSETPEMYDLDDFLEEQENPVTSAVSAPTVVQERPAASEGDQHNRDLKERCVM
ncbi:hypothetical protein PIB30_062014 [Stylosanthes scabra]|uniref:Uncharacterized protein n=1 Tax=Stylosanthes scabra TaxID=79078 RepID=A0ABU6RKY6_9FABA|nr:hypothetical protein [Stylosanthes scabra]